MKKKFKLGVIGAGFMSTAIINGAIKSKILSPKEIIVSDVSQISLDKISTLGINTTLNNIDLANNSEFILFAIKPQNLDAVLSDIKNCKCNKFISIMAGVKKEKIKSSIKDVLVARCMPNTPCAIGCGAVGLDVLDYTDDNDVNFIKNLLSSFAKVVIVEENKLNAVTGVSGSSPAYFYLFLQGIIESGVKHGLSYEDAKTALNKIGLGIVSAGSEESEDYEDGQIMKQSVEPKTAVEKNSTIEVIVAVKKIEIYVLLNIFNFLCYYDFWILFLMCGKL